VNSSTIDNQPVSILEAFAAGLPVVTTPAGGIPELVRHEETGLLVPCGEPAAMASAVAGLLEDPPRALALARRAREEAERHAWPRLRRAWAAAYGEGPA
jgi:glycosyltransferase involved in cell wall biosynthesis